MLKIVLLPYILAHLLPHYLVTAIPELKQVHVVTRHGARTPLPKDAETLTELAGSTLTPTGQKQLYDVGTWLRQTYNVNGFIEVYNPSEIRLESSNLDRTLTSVNSLSRGLFPTEAQAGEHGEDLTSLLSELPSIPVYSSRDSNDISLRAYHGSCPTFESNLEKLYESSQWKMMETSYRSLLETIAALFPEDWTNNGFGDDNDPIQNGSLVLKLLWTYYDKINVARTECRPDPLAHACISLGASTYQLVDALTDAEFNDLELLMGRTEELKFGRGTAKALLGSQLLLRMINRITSTNGKFFVYSAHAPTLLGLLSTLQEWMTDEVHPNYGSAIIMEVYQETVGDQEYSIRFLYKSSLKSTATYIPITKASCEEEFTGQAPPTTSPGLGIAPQHCVLNRFISWAMENTYFETEDWCDACNNQIADVCMLHILTKDRSTNIVNDMEAFLSDDENDALVIAGTFFGGLLAGMLIMSLGCFFCTRRKASKEPQAVADIPEASKTKEVESPILKGEMN